MATNPERVLNRTSAAPRVPSWARAPWWILSVLFLLIAFEYVLRPIEGGAWLPWMYVAAAAVFPFAMWRASVSWVDIGPERITVRHPIGSSVASTPDILDVEAHRHWQSPLKKGKVPPYWIKMRRASGRPWLLQYIEPAAGDELLAALHRLEKPIMVYKWQ